MPVCGHSLVSTATSLFLVDFYPFHMKGGTRGLPTLALMGLWKGDGEDIPYREFPKAITYKNVSIKAIGDAFLLLELDNGTMPDMPSRRRAN